MLQLVPVGLDLYPLPIKTNGPLPTSDHFRPTLPDAPPQ
jgi:hypothetical protein